MEELSKDIVSIMNGLRKYKKLLTDDINFNSYHFFYYNKL